MIVKDEERYLPACLESVRTFVHEIIIVDTGSKDRTVKIAKKYGAKVFHIPWEDDFSKARNVSLEKATGDWILHLDADEQFEQEDKAKICHSFNQEQQKDIFFKLLITILNPPEMYVCFPAYGYGGTSPNTALPAHFMNKFLCLLLSILQPIVYRAHPFVFIIMDMQKLS